MLTFGAGVLFFPISYVFGDILTEVYGYARARKVIWAGFAALGFAAFMASVVVALPPAPFWKHQEAYEIAFGSAWRIVLASMTAYFCGEFVNSFVLARMKVWMEGRRLWMRTIGSTIAGEAVDSALFYPLAFYGSGIIPDDKLPVVMLAQFVAKVGVEVVFTPVTYKIVGGAQARRARGLLRPGHGFQPVHAQDLSAGDGTNTAERVVRVVGFEPTTSCAQGRRATGLRHTLTGMQARF